MIRFKGRNFCLLDYYVASFNAGGESASNLYTVTINDPTCLTDEWTSLGLSGGQITVSEPVDKLYCYLSVDDGPWTRIPASPHARSPMPSS